MIHLFRFGKSSTRQLSRLMLKGFSRAYLIVRSVTWQHMAEQWVTLKGFLLHPAWADPSFVNSSSEGSLCYSHSHRGFSPVKLRPWISLTVLMVWSLPRGGRAGETVRNGST